MEKVKDNVSPQCQYFVLRKKRLCRMTVRPGLSYCGEHDPEPTRREGEADDRIPCPLDPKHTCYVSKLDKHLAICNARPQDQPPYIVKNINAPSVEAAPRTPLSEVPGHVVLRVVDKINHLYEKYLEGNIATLPPRDIHPEVLPEFSKAGRAESSLRHLRQTSRLMWLLQEEGLVKDETCYVELGAGKGQLSYFICSAWCTAQSGSGTLLVDRAALRHKRDNRLRGAAAAAAARLRADLADLDLARAPVARDCERVVGVAKHLCGAATDLALRCVSAAGGCTGAAGGCAGAVVATCCHHRCDRATYVGNDELQEVGITEEDFNAMLGIVSWGTCGDGRSRGARGEGKGEAGKRDQAGDQALKNRSSGQEETSKDKDQTARLERSGSMDQLKAMSCEEKEAVGRRAKALLDWGRVRHLRGRGYDARLCYFVPTEVSLENVCIVAKKIQ